MIKLDLDQITIDKGTQSRDKISQEWIDKLADDIKRGADMMPIVVFFNGLEYVLGDGFHRFHAHRQCGLTQINSDVRTGTARDAKRFSWSANSKHGLPRSRETLRKIVLEALADEEAPSWTDTYIAELCDVSRPFVAKMRGESKADTITYTRNGVEVQRDATRKNSKAEQIKKEIVGAMPPEIKADPVYDPAKDAMLEIAKENEQLKDRLAVGVMEGSEEEKTLAADTLAELREEVRKLQIINTSLVISRDQFQNENAQLKKQVAVLQRKLKQYE